MSDLLVTMRDVRGAGQCSSGARRFFARHGLNWQQFLRSGISAAVLLDTGDAMAARVVEVARGRRR